MTRPQRGWRVPLALVSLSALPVVAGVLRLVQLRGGPEVMPADARFTASPVAVVVHIVCSAVFALVGAFQFAGGFRRAHPRWHRVAGRLLVVAGLAVAVSALWLTLFYPRKDGTGDLLFVLRLVAGSAMAASLVWALLAIRRRDVATHRAWMMRAYALGLGAGTQVVTEGFGHALFGANVLALDASRGLAWLLNLAVAEWAIRRGGRGPRRAVDRPRAEALAADLL